MNETIEWLTCFFGWCSAINFGLLVVSSTLLLVLRKWVMRLHGTMFGLTESELSRAYFQYLAHFKIAVIILNFVPFIVLKCLL